MVDDQPTKFCEQCGAPRPPRSWHHCSRACSDAARKKPRRNCENCGIKVHHWKHRFCSLACKSAITTIPVADRFWAKVQKTDGCWLWTGYLSPQGYGNFNMNGRSRITNRVVWELTTGQKPPKGFDVCHHCDNPRCVRPDHLFLGTRSDNVHDMIQKGRDRKAVGERASAAKLTADDVVTIRRDYAAGVKMAALGQRFHVSERSISAVIRRQSWAHIE